MGPLQGMRIIELAGIGPTPFAGMMLSDLGAEVIRVDRVGGSGSPVGSQSGPMERGKRAVAINLKRPEGVEALLRLVEVSDGLFEGFRAGVVERLGVGPRVCLARNPELVYGRMTGWGQAGPLADRAGHDINYISLAGPLAHIGRPGQPPSVPLNLIGDFGGGSVFLVLGMVAALLEVARGGNGQVVDAAMVDGAAYLMSPLYAAHASGFWTDDYGTNFLDSGAYFYEVYGTADGRWLAVGAIEPQFHDEFMAGIGLAGAGDLPDQMDRDRWPEMKQRVGEIIAGRTLNEWMAVFDGTDACVTPVLTMGQTPAHPHARARSSFFEACGVSQPRPAPRFEGTPAEPATEAKPPGSDTGTILEELGYSTSDVEALRASGAVA
ncbi:CaiB/BaiF CoA transferase family protein [Candidatus Poriferisocius sp.]|uniref:CaiB/BaiF CoA transferase family protein n=1 Tax=Candidatus Poriferisocius sp. TaxID=3101276 RepID=UPI003B022161